MTIEELLDKLEEANRIFGAGISIGAENHADVELCRKLVDGEIWPKSFSLIKKYRETGDVKNVTPIQTPFLEKIKREMEER